MPFAILRRHDAGAIKLKWPNMKGDMHIWRLHVFYLV